MNLALWKNRAEFKLGAPFHGMACVDADVTPWNGAVSQRTGGPISRNGVCGRPFGCKWFFDQLARSQVLSCVRPVDAAVHTPLACMEIADRVQLA